VYSSDVLASGRAESIAQVGELFRFLMNRPGEYPAGRDGLHSPRAVCDFIAGMTDRYFERFYEERLVS
jgi:dGTP triphosphohydrolase